MIRQATLKDLDTLAKLATQLWPHHSIEVMKEEIKPLLDSTKAAFFIYEPDLGFAQCQLRFDYVEGCHHSPVAYLEGIYVPADQRQQGYGKQLLSACEAWARAQGCQEFASDCELTNEKSARFHRAMHFQEANRIICFTKKL